MSIIFFSKVKADHAEAALHKCSYEKVFWKYAGNLQENAHANLWFQ